MNVIRTLLFSLFLFYHLVYVLQRIKVDPQVFTVTYKRETKAEVNQFFNFFHHVHILEKLCPWLWRLNEADARILSIGKVFTAIIKLPILGERRIFLSVTNYNPPKYFAIESKDEFFKYRIEIRLKNYGNHLVLKTSAFCNKTTALFQYTVGNMIFYITRKQLEQSIKNVVELYENVNELPL